MLLAYLRGFLTPNAPQGFRSFLRERLIFDALQAEITAEYEARLIQTEAAFAVHMKVQAVPRRLHDMQKVLVNCRDIQLFDWRPKKTLSASGSVDAFIKLYHAMEKAGQLTAD